MNGACKKDTLFTIRKNITVVTFLAEFQPKWRQWETQLVRERSFCSSPSKTKRVSCPPPSASVRNHRTCGHQRQVFLLRIYLMWVVSGLQSLFGMVIRRGACGLCVWVAKCSSVSDQRLLIVFGIFGIYFFVSCFQNPEQANDQSEETASKISGSKFPTVDTSKLKDISKRTKSVA